MWNYISESPIVFNISSGNHLLHCDLMSLDFLPIKKNDRGHPLVIDTDPGQNNSV